MQSGISVSKELQEAFNEFVSSPAQRGIVIGIQSEALTPLHTLPSKSTDFFSDLSGLPFLLQKDAASYIILRRYQNAPDGYVAVTYVPDSAPVRQKMLFASTRLTLVRELGTERFRESLFMTEMKELEPQGWEKHDASGALKAPLTEEEENLQGIKDAEAAESRGTSGRRLETGGHFSLAITDEAKLALEGFKDSDENLLQLKINVQTETIDLADLTSTNPERLSSAISLNEPRYSLFKYTHNLEGDEQSPVVFIYTCPAESKIKERMVYASSKRGVLEGAGLSLGFKISKNIEISSPSEITAATLEEEFRPKQEIKQGFSRPKKPGKR